MNEAELRQWVEANPDKVNTWDIDGCTPLYAAAMGRHKTLQLALWLLDEKGADVNPPLFMLPAPSTNLVPYWTGVRILP